MTDYKDLIDRANAALDGVTPGPWSDHLFGEPTAVASGRRLIASTGGYSDGKEGTRAKNIKNAEFIAASRQLVPDLTASLSAAIARAEKAEAALVRAKVGLVRARDELDEYSRQEYPLDHPVHERYRKRDYDANPARIALSEISSEAKP